MIEKVKHKPIAITSSFYQLGTRAFPAYLSIGDDAMIIEGGIGATFATIVEQVKDLGVPPEQIKYIALTHTHADHIGAVPYLKKIWPHLKIVGSPVAARTLKNRDVTREAVRMDRALTGIMMSKGEIAEPPAELEDYAFDVDVVVNEGDKIDLGSGVEWTFYDTPGHSPCHMSLHNEAEGVLVIGDATGFYVPAKDTTWPNYFNSLEGYCNSIRKLAALPASKGALSHNCVIDQGLGGYLRRAIETTEAFHLELMERLGNGEDPEKIAVEKAKWVNTLTDDHPFEVMYTLAKVLIKRSQSEAGKKGLFSPP